MSPRYRTVDSPIGPLIVVANPTGLTHILFPDTGLASVGLDPDMAEASHDVVLDAAVVQLTEYFARERTEFDLPLDLQGKSFERDAWLALATIPYGETISYGEQADRVGRSGAARAVGAANGRNPIPIVLPCHRVIGADGSLTGFGGGLGIKQALLELERGTQQLPF